MQAANGIDDDKDVAHALEWLYETCGEKAGAVKARVLKAQQAYLTLARDPIERGGDLELEMLGADVAASYLAQADALLHNGTAYDLGLGTRILPFVKQLGENLDKVQLIEGAAGRAEKMLTNNGGDPVGTFFELVTAVRYVEDGYQVAFISERPGIAKTPDFRIARAGASQHVECKRLRSGPYEARERTEQRRIFAPLADYIERRRLSLHLDVTYAKELKEIPDGYLLAWAEKAVACRLHLSEGYPWLDEYGSGTVKPANLKAVQQDTRDSDLLFGPKLARLLIGHAVSEPYSMAGDFTPSRQDPRYIRSARAGTVVTWRCDAEASVTNKSRHVKAKLSEIDNQLFEGGEGIGHIGIDADGEVDVSDIRRSKNYQAVLDFKYRTKLNALYLHYFVCRITETNTWMIDETVDNFGLAHPLPLDGSGRLFTGSETMPGGLPAWHQKPPAPPMTVLPR